MKTAPTVPNGAKQGAETHGIPGVEASIWTERMVSALVNGVEGGKWYSLMDKVCAPKTLALAWERVRANKGAAGVDGQSVERFEAKAGAYLAELAEELREGTYRPEAVKRVEIPKGDGQTRPLGIPTVVFLAASLDAAFGNHWTCPLQQDVADGRNVHRLDVCVRPRRCSPVQMGAYFHLDNLDPVHFNLKKSDCMKIKADLLVLNDGHIMNQ